jgi:hypothetical protein
MRRVALTTTSWTGLSLPPGPDIVRCDSSADTASHSAGSSREAVEFDTHTPHWFGATGSGPVEFLSLVGKQGERAHVRTATKGRG